MKKELRFYGRFLLETAGICAMATAILLAGLLITRNGANLFGTYASMYPIFVFLVPFVYATSARNQLNLCIAYGRKRIACFWAAEFMLAGIVLLMVALAKIVSVCSAFVGELRLGGFSAGPGHLIFMTLFGMLVVQIGLLLGNILDGKKRMICILCIIVVMAATFIVLFLILNEETNVGALSDIFRFRLTDSRSWIIYGVLAAAGAVPACFAARQYRKAVYCG